MFGAFFGVAFCLNFWLFRKSRRYEWAWLILILASVSMFFYNRAFGRVGGFGPTRHIEFTRTYGVAGEKTVLNFTETGLLSPAARNVTIAAASSRQLFVGLDREVRAVIVEENRQLYPVRLKAGAFTTVSSVGFSDLPGEGIGLMWSRTQKMVRVMVVNKTGLALINPRFTPALGSYFVEEGKNHVLSVPAATFDSWTVRSAAMQPQMDSNQSGLPNFSSGVPSNYYPMPSYPQPRRSRWFGRSRRSQAYTQTIANSAGYYANAYGHMPLDDAGNAPLAFQFELPDTAAPMTSTSAREVRCRRTVTLFIPVPAGGDETVRTIRTATGRSS